MVRALSVALSACLFVACAEEPEPEAPRRDRRSKRTKTELPAQIPASEPEPEPAPQPVAAPSEPTQRWWCLCYQREGASGPEPETACRGSESQCRKLEGRVAKGSKDIIAGSMTRSCQPIEGTHPSDVAGTHEQWKPSKLAGAWVSEGVCQLMPGAAAPAPEPALGETGEPAPTDELAEGSFMSTERIGELSQGMSTAQLRHGLGEPERRGAVEEMGATGLYEQVWTYPDGLSVVMAADTRHGPQTISALTIVAPSKLKTRRGIGIGDSREAVERAYGDVRAPEQEAPASESRFVAGSIYGGLIFEFDEGAVSRVFLGAAAE